jgi:hypothetical protein
MLFPSQLQEGESFSYSHHKRWKIIMHIKVVGNKKKQGSVMNLGLGIVEKKRVFGGTWD